MQSSERLSNLTLEDRLVELMRDTGSVAGAIAGSAFADFPHEVRTVTMSNDKVRAHFSSVNDGMYIYTHS